MKTLSIFSSHARLTIHLMEGLDPVYSRNGVVIKNTTGIDHTDVVVEDRNGFRLPTSMEWELAARYKGGDNFVWGYRISRR